MQNYLSTLDLAKTDKSKFKIKDCVFCQIIKGKEPAYKVYEDDKFLAFLDYHPLTKGNTLVIPKKHYRWVIDVPEFGGYWELAKRVALGAKKALDADWISFLTLGKEVSHAHIRIVPRYNNDLHTGEMPTFGRVEHFSVGEMKEIAKRMADAIK